MRLGLHFVFVQEEEGFPRVLTIAAWLIFDLFMVYLLVLPEFPREPADQIVTQGGNVTFVCQASGVPTPSISWTFSGGSLPSSSEVNGGMLTVAFVKNNPSFEGNYICTAVSRAGVSKTTAKLTVDGE